MRISDWSSDVCSSDLDFDPLLLAADVDRGDNAAPALLQLLDLGGGEDLHALLLELLAGEGGDLFVLDRKQAVENLDDGHLGYPHSIEARALAADRSGAHDQNGSGSGVRNNGTIGGVYGGERGYQDGELSADVG